MSKLRYLIMIVLFIIFILNNKVSAIDLRAGIDSFPTNYQGYLRAIKERHQNWNFIALYTNISWNTAISNENIFGKNLVPISYSNAWKNTNQNEYNIEVDAGWVDSSRQAIEYTMDPRNFLNDVRIFQFERLSYDENTNRKDAIERILYGTEFYQNQVNYLDSNGNTIYTNDYYSDLILNAARTSGVSVFHLSSRIKQEVGPFLSHNSISGNVDGYKGLYNFYNIGATSSSEPMGAIKNGLQYAKDGKGASQEIRQKYLIPWDTKQKAITGGAIFIGSSYIVRGQDTIYLQKFHVSDTSGGSLFNHQYMTNILAPYTESSSIYKGYVNTNMLDTNISFIIPVYSNMPEINTESPSINYSNYIQDNTGVLANVTTSLNIRSGPGTSYESIIKVGSQTKMTRISKCIGAGELWDRVYLDNGIVGYAYREYLVDASSNIKQEELIFDISLDVSNSEISGLQEKVSTVQNIKSKITTSYRVEIENARGQVMGENDLVGTGSRLKIISDSGEILAVYKFILYGDVNGDGKINSIDLLVLQRHILEIESIQDVFYKAGNINKNGRKPSSLDSLLIQRHILGIKIIVQ